MNKMKMSIALLVCAALVSPLVLAQETETGSFYDLIVEKQGTYNELITQIQVPGILKGFMSGRITLKIDNEVIGLVLDHGVIKELKQGPISNPTMEITTSRAFVDELIASENPMNTLVQGLKDGRIQKKDIGIKSKIKGAFASVALKLFSFFG